jgi:Zn-dependent protease with chaperone function
MFSLNVVYILILFAIIITIGNAINTIFADLRNRYLSLKHQILGDFLYIAILFILALLMIYLWTGDILGQKSQQALKQLL